MYYFCGTSDVHTPVAPVHSVFVHEKTSVTKVMPVKIRTDISEEKGGHKSIYGSLV